MADSILTQAQSTPPSPKAKRQAFDRRRYFRDTSSHHGNLSRWFNRKLAAILDPSTPLLERQRLWFAVRLILDQLGGELGITEVVDVRKDAMPDEPKEGGAA
jgi:hypothetical protein